MRSQTDERLVDLVRAGNDAAFEAIVARYRRPLMRHCTRILSEERAEDVVQQSFVRALAAMRRDERPLDLKPWLYTIVHNGTLNALRERAIPSDTLEEEIDGVERPEQAFERREGLRSVVAAVGALPQRQRDALVLRELEGRSYDEIATELGVTDGAVRQLLNRARTTLRAGVTAITPTGLLLRIPLGADDSIADRVAELTALSASAGVGTFAAKTAASAVVAGALIGGAAVVPGGGVDPLPPAARGAVAQAGDRAVEAAGEGEAEAAEKRGAGDDERRERAREDEVAGDDDRGSHRRRGRSGDGDDGADDHSGPGGGGATRSGPSGPGSGGDHSGASGPGPGGGRDNSGPGSVGETLADDHSGPGSGSSGSGSSGSGSSGSGSSGSGSGSSGSGSSGSGSGSLDRSGSNAGSG